MEYPWGYRMTLIPYTPLRPIQTLLYATPRSPNCKYNLPVGWCGGWGGGNIDRTHNAIPLYFIIRLSVRLYQKDQ
jgi:hypothetical protein